MSRTKKKRSRRQMSAPYDRVEQTERPQRLPRPPSKTTMQILQEEFVNCREPGCNNLVTRDLIYCVLHRD